jgi:hypothetical protein
VPQASRADAPREVLNGVGSWGDPWGKWEPKIADEPMPSSAFGVASWATARPSRRLQSPLPHRTNSRRPPVSPSPSRRPSAADTLDHPYFADVREAERREAGDLGVGGCGCGWARGWVRVCGGAPVGGRGPRGAPDATSMRATSWMAQPALPREADVQGSPCYYSFARRYRRGLYLPSGANLPSFAFILAPGTLAHPTPPPSTGFTPSVIAFDSG